MFALSGIAFSVAWFYLVQSYRQLNSGKFKVIHAIEQNLPLALYEAEWKALGEGRDPKLYRPLTKIEIYAPLTFALGDYQLSAPNIYFINKSNRFLSLLLYLHSISLMYHRNLFFDMP